MRLSALALGRHGPCKVLSNAQSTSIFFRVTGSQFHSVASQRQGFQPSLAEAARASATLNGAKEEGSQATRPKQIRHGVDEDLFRSAEVEAVTMPTPEKPKNATPAKVKLDRVPSRLSLKKAIAQKTAMYPRPSSNGKPLITVVGVGGAGGNAVNNMIASQLRGVRFVVANTDAQALSNSLAEHKVQLGREITSGLGAGAKPEVGRRAAEEGLDDIIEAIDGSNMVFITGGMGGGTGTGAAPVIAKTAMEMGVLTVSVVSMPFRFEGPNRMRLAQMGLGELEGASDTLIVVPNQNLLAVSNPDTTLVSAFQQVDTVLHEGVRGVTDLIVNPGLINLDFADIHTVMAGAGRAMMGSGEAEGPNRAVEAAQQALTNPLLGETSLASALGLLVTITGGEDLTLFEVDEIMDHIRSDVAPETNIIFGSCFDGSLQGKLRVSIIVSGIEILDESHPPPRKERKSSPRRTNEPSSSEGGLFSRFFTF